MQPDLRRLHGMLGFARRAGKVTIGTELVCRALSLRGEKKPCLAVYASTASEPTKKRVRDKCAFYGVPSLEIPTDVDTLARLLGKSFSIATVGIHDESFAEEIIKSLGIEPQSLRKGISAVAETGDIHGDKVD